MSCGVPITRPAREERFDTAGFNTEGRPLCPFCSAPWGDFAMGAYDLDAADECESGRFGPPTCTVSISCQSCGREMYRKEGFKVEY